MQLNQLSQAEFIRVVGPVFEQSPWAAERAWLKRPFADTDELHAVLTETVRAGTEAEQIGMIRAHPDLVGRATRTGRALPEIAGDLTAGQEPLSIAEIEAFQKYNAEYRYKFGFPFVIGAHRHDKAAILAAFEKRLQNTREQELAVAVAELCQIAGRRLRSMAPGRVTAARLSTQVLDLTSGSPADGMQIELWSIKNGSFTLLKTVKTNDEGRPETPLLSAAEMQAGEYELVFCLGDYFAAKTGTGSRFLNRIPVRFMITDLEATYHLPLLCSPWAYSVCRGG